MKNFIYCKDCKYRGNYYLCPMVSMSAASDDVNIEFVDLTCDDGYCDIGENK